MRDPRDPRMPIVVPMDSPAAEVIMEQARAADADPFAIVNGIAAEFPLLAKMNLGWRKPVRVERNVLHVTVGSGNPPRRLEVEYEPGVDLYVVRIGRRITRGARRGEWVLDAVRTHVYGEDLAETAITLHGQAWERLRR